MSRPSRSVRHPKSEIRKRKLPDRDQIEYFRLGFTSVFHVESFEDQFTEFWDSIPAEYRDSQNGSLEQIINKQTRLEHERKETFEAMNEDQYKHGLRGLNDPLLNSNDLIMKPPHCLIRSNIQTAVNHYLNSHNQKEILPLSSRSHSSTQSTFNNELETSPLLQPQQLRRSKRSKARTSKLTNTNTNTVNLDNIPPLQPIPSRRTTPILRGKRGRPSSPKKQKKSDSISSENDYDSENNNNNHNKRKKRKNKSYKPPDCDGDLAMGNSSSNNNSPTRSSLLTSPRSARNRKVNERPHVLFAANVGMPFYDDLVEPFEKYQQKRKNYKIVNSKKEVNSVTKLTRNHKLKQVKETKGFELMKTNEILLKIAIFHSNKSSERYTKSHEYLVRTNQCLSDLKDSIYCLMDKTDIGKCVKNSFFFIEDTFYDDCRHSNDDNGGGTHGPPFAKLSQTIVDWSRNNEHWKQTGVYMQKSMENTRFCDLNLRLGSHYLYVHQGDCQHVIIFTDCRASQKNDCNNVLAYPMCIYRQILKRQKCGVCEMYPAHFVVYGDKLTTHNPFFFCERCYHPLHYDKEGNLLYQDFQVFKYIHD